MCQTELKLDMVVSSSVVWFGLWPSSVVVWVGPCHVMLALTCPGSVILDGITVLMVSLPGHWNLVTINVLRLYVAFCLGHPTLKLRYCTTLFTMRFPPWSLPRVGNGDRKRKVVTPGHRVDAGGNTGKRVRLTRKTCPSLMVHDTPNTGLLKPRRWKRLRPPSSAGEVSEVGEPRNLFPRLGVG